MNNNTKNIMIVGVGGQGALLASKTLGQVLLDAGYDVKVSEEFYSGGRLMRKKVYDKVD